MKKIYILLAILIVISLLAACGTAVEESISATEWNDTAPTITDAPAATQSIDDVDTSAYYARVIEEQDDALTPFVREAVAQGIDADTLFANYLGEMAIPGDSPVFQKTDRTITADGVFLRTALIHEQPIIEADLTKDADIDTLVETQYEYYERNGYVDYSGTTEEPAYEIVGIAINGSYVKGEFSLKINGVDNGTFTLDNNVLVIPLSTERFSANAPVEITLTKISGNLPTPDYIYVGVHSNISNAR